MKTQYSREIQTQAGRNPGIQPQSNPFTLQLLTFDGGPTIFNTCNDDYRCTLFHRQLSATTDDVINHISLSSLQIQEQSSPNSGPAPLSLVSKLVAED